MFASPNSRVGSGKDITLDYTEQDGKLETIASKYDYCITPMTYSKMVTVASVSNSGEITINGTANFENQQAIVCFTLLDKDGNAIQAPLSLTISADNLKSKDYLTSSTVPILPNSLTLSLDGTTNVVYAALRGINNNKVTLGSGIYSYTTTSNVTFEAGKYYNITVKMNDEGNKVDLSNLHHEEYTAENGDVLTGTLPSGVQLFIANNAMVKLKDVTINATITAGIKCLGNATIILEGNNTVQTTVLKKAGIQAAPGGIKKLTIVGDGNLTATGGVGAAGIGSGGDDTCGDISISGGTVTATGGDGAAGIGCGPGGSCRNITITNGVTQVKATKGDEAPYSIGKGKNCGTITIGGTKYYDGPTMTWASESLENELKAETFTYQPSH